MTEEHYSLLKQHDLDGLAAELGPLRAHPWAEQMADSIAALIREVRAWRNLAASALELTCQVCGGECHSGNDDSTPEPSVMDDCAACLDGDRHEHFTDQEAAIGAMNTAARADVYGKDA